VENRVSFLGIFSLTLSGILIMVSEFMPWTGTYSAFEMFALFSYLGSMITYLFPFIATGLIFISVVGFLLANNFRKVGYLLLFLAADLLFIFLLQVIDYNGRYLWNYSGIYLAFLALILLLFGFINELAYKGESKNQSKGNPTIEQPIKDI
jgi:hypothetical protein